MAGNRKQPFGYKMEFGEIVEAPEEVGIVLTIFKQYLTGASYTEIVEILKDQSIVYDVDKVWNKNMVARILSDSRYLGENGFAAIIKRTDFDAVLEKRTKKAAVPQKTEGQKMLRKLCTGRVTEGVEVQTVAMLNGLIQNPQQVVAHEYPKHEVPEILLLQTKLDEEMSCQPINEDETLRLITASATAKYQSLGNEEYETLRLRNLLMQATTQSGLNADLLKQIVSAVITHRGGRISIRLKNGQLIGKG